MLDPRTRDVLFSAWKENRLLAVHIDLQPCFSPDKELCGAVHAFSSSLRSLNVENLWVGYAGNHMDMRNGRTTVKALETEQNTGRNILPNVGAAPDDYAVLKDQNSAMYHPAWPLHRHMHITGKDTILITGVNYDCCVGETIQDAILSDKYNVIAVGDCINIPVRTNSGFHCYARSIFNDCAGRAGELGIPPLPRAQIGDQYQRRFHLTTSSLIVSALASEKGPS